VRNEGFVAQSLEAGGWGGRPDGDGQDASMSVCQGDVRNTPIETLELKTPVMVLERSLWPDSGGAGKFRGGLGVQTRIKSLVDGRWNAGPPGYRTGCAPWGLQGGRSGAVGHTQIRQPGEAEFQPSINPRPFAPAETEVLYRTSGGGGWGDPLDRDSAHVLHDVREGYITVERAREDYGVVLSQSKNTVDEAATLKLRQQQRDRVPQT
jgi:N-methylhydantoinase B